MAADFEIITRPKPGSFTTITRCRGCGARIDPLWDMGKVPLPNDLRDTVTQAQELPRYPLVLCICPSCTLGQLSIAVDKSLLFGDRYPYQTPVSQQLSEHYERILNDLDTWVDMRGRSKKKTWIVEIGSNSGEFLSAAAARSSIDVIGVDPSAQVALIARARGIPTSCEFFNTGTALRIRSSGTSVNVVVARHCLAHVDDIHEIVRGVGHLLDDDGIFYIENAYWIDTMASAQYDQIYHEHMSYMTLTAIDRIVRVHNLKVVHVDLSAVHGGSIMVYVAKRSSKHKPTPFVAETIAREKKLIVDGLPEEFVTRSMASVDRLVAQVDRPLWLYGASAKATTLLSLVGSYPEAAQPAGLNQPALGAAVLGARGVFDRSPLKVGKFMPGSGLQILDVGGRMGLALNPPDRSMLLVTAWNYADEIAEQLSWYTRAGGKLIYPR